MASKGKPLLTKKNEIKFLPICLKHLDGPQDFGENIQLTDEIKYDFF